MSNIDFEYQPESIETIAEELILAIIRTMCPEKQILLARVLLAISESTGFGEASLTIANGRLVLVKEMISRK
jgi:hypothetical protein